MTSTRELFFNLLRSALGYEVNETDTPDTDALRELYKLSRSQDMAHLISYALSERGLLPAEGEARDAFKKQENLAVYRHSLLTIEQERITAALESSGLDFIPLKGARIRALYPKGWMRTSCDIDILVREGELDGAIAALRDGLGYRVGKKEFHDISLYSKSGVHLELHFGICENIEQLDKLLSRVWEYARPVGEGKHEHTLDDNFFLFHHTAHMYYHFKSGGCGVKALIDLYLLRDALDIDAEQFGQMLTDTATMDFYRAMIHLTDVLFGNAEYTELDRQVEDFIITGGVYGTRESHITAARSEGGETRSYVIRRIFPSYRQLSGRYPLLKRYKILTPLFVVVRWFDIFSAKKRKKAMEEIATSASLGKEELDAASLLFSELGI